MGTVRIIDGHAHVASMRFVPVEFVRGIARNMIAAGRKLALNEELVTQFMLSQNQDHTADQLVREMDAAGVEKTVLLAPDFSYALPGCASAEELAAGHHEIRLKHPGRFHVFQGIDPRGGAAALRTLEYAVTHYGFEGLKLYPPCGYSPSDPALWPFYELCQHYQLPVLLHTGPSSPCLAFSFAHPLLLDQAAQKFSDVNFIIAHGGVNYCEDATLLCAYRPNVFLDIAGVTSVLHPEGWARHLHSLFRLGLNHKIIFGTDAPLVNMTDTLAGFVTKLLAPGGPMSGLPTNDIEAILSGNISNLLAHRVAVTRTTAAQRAIETC